jgi:hypothetical protein
LTPDPSQETSVGKDLLLFGVVGGLAAVAFWVIVAYLLRHALVRLSAACGRGWDRAADFGGNVLAAMEARNWAPAGAGA